MENNEEQKEKKNLREILKPIYKVGSVVSKGLSIALLIGGLALTVTFQGESIKVPKNSNLSQIAAQYDITQSKLEKRNKLENSDYIQAGQDLILYNKGAKGIFQKVSDTLDKYWF